VGKSAHPLGILVAQEYGIDLSRHVARQLTAKDIELSDLIVVMDGQNEARIKERFPSEVQNKTVCILGWELEERVDIPDPYGGQIDTFRRSFEMITMALEALLRRLGGP
jgi:protein-tyrosine phosphatase